MTPSSPPAQQGAPGLRSLTDQQSHRAWVPASSLQSLSPLGGLGLKRRRLGLSPTPEGGELFKPLQLRPRQMQTLCGLQRMLCSRKQCRQQRHSQPESPTQTTGAPRITLQSRIDQNQSPPTIQTIQGLLPRFMLDKPLQFHLQPGGECRRTLISWIARAPWPRPVRDGLLHLMQCWGLRSNPNEPHNGQPGQRWGHPTASSCRNRTLRPARRTHPVEGRGHADREIAPRRSVSKVLVAPWPAGWYCQFERSQDQPPRQCQRHNCCATKRGSRTTRCCSSRNSGSIHHKVETATPSGWRRCADHTTPPTPIPRRSPPAAAPKRSMTPLGDGQAIHGPRA